MATHGCTVEWSRGDAAFTDLKYSRAHRWSFDGGAQVKASAEQGFVVDRYSDAAEARMGRFDDGRRGIVEVLLRPHVVITGAKAADDAAIEALHHAAHERCDIGNSIRGEVRVQGRWSAA